MNNHSFAQFTHALGESIDPQLLADISSDRPIITDCNEALATLTDYSRDALQGKSVSLIWDKVHSTYEHAQLLAKLQQKKPHEAIIHCTTKSGDRTAWLYRIWPSNAAKHIMLMTITDVTSLHLVAQHDNELLKQQLAIKQEVIQCIAHVGISGIWISDATGAVIEMDDVLSGQLNSQTADDVLHFNWQERLHPDDKARVFEAWTTFVNNKDPNQLYQIDFRVLPPASDDCRYYKGYATPIVSDGEIIRYVGYTVDVTEEKEQQIRLESLNKALLDSDKQSALRQEQVSKLLKMAFVSETASGIAHQLNQPLTVVSSLVQIWVKNTLSKPHCTVPIEDLMLVNDGIEMMGKIIHNVNNLFSHNDITEKRPINLDRLIRTMMAEYQNKHPNITFTASIASIISHKRLLVSEVLLDQLIKNLISNAVEAMTEHKPDSPHVTLQIEWQKNELSVHVIDNGPGVAESLTSDIFEPFFTTKATGSGIGLSLINRACEIEGGKLEYYDNTPGAHFCFTLNNVPEITDYD